MKRQIFLSICCIAGLSFLQACSKNDDDNPWSSPSKVLSGSNITSSKVSSNDKGDIVLVWEETEEQVRIDQELTDAHDASIPYSEDAAISADRDMDPDPEVFEAYDSTNLTHRTDAKVADYGNHEAHIHVDIYSKLSVKARVYSSSRGSWLESITLQSGFWKKTQKGSRFDSNDEQVTVTDNVSSLPNAHISSTASSSGNAVVAWVQVRESLDPDAAGDAGDEYDIYTAQYSASNTTWTTAEKLSLSSDSEKPALKDFALSLDANGNIQLLWIARNSDSSNSTHVYQASYDKTVGAWSSSALLSDSSTSADSVKVVMLDNASVVAVWSGVNESAKATYVEQDGEGDLCAVTATICDGTQTNLYANWFNADGWQASPTLISEKGEVGEFEMVTNNVNSVWLVWEQNDAYVTRSNIDGVESFVNSIATNAKINVRQIDIAVDAETWLPPISVHNSAEDGSYENNKQPSIAIDSSGTVMVAWSQDTPYDFTADDSSKWNNSQRETIWENVFKTDWQGAQQLASDERFSFLKPKIAAVEKDKFSVVWRGWSASHAESGHQLFSLDYNVSSGEVSQLVEASRDAAIIEDVYFLPSSSNKVKLIWTSDQESINTVSK